jgi:signal transduction histidine kinase/ActR/RegA family two-component response regulator
MLRLFKTHRTFQLSRYFSIASLITIIAAALVLSWMYRMLAIDDLMHQGERNHITLTQTFSNAIWPQVKFFIDSDSQGIVKGQSANENQLHFKTLDASVIKLIKNTPVLKIDIFDLQGRTVYATDPDNIGKIVPEDYPGKTAAITGKPKTELRFLDYIYTVNGILRDRYVLSSFLPVRDPVSDEIRAIFEISADVSNLYAKIIESRNNFAIVVIAILGLVYAALFLLVRRADLIIRRQASEREQYLSEIESINQDLDQNARELAIAHDKAVEASTYKSQFLATMSHELRTPLNAIIGYSEMLAEDLGDAGQEHAIEDLQKIKNAGKHLLTVINEILDISKIEAGRINLHLEDFDITDVIEGIASTIEPLARKGDNTFILTVPEPLGVIHSDVTRFRQILLNLLSNACKFTHEGRVELEARRVGEGDLEHIVCTVSDTGIGIAEDNIEKIFKPFQQADNSTTRVHGGTGLGLTISKRFCELLGGSIRAESETGKGTRFIVKLPVKSHIDREHDRARLPDTDDPAAQVSNNRKPRERRKRISRILLIDNDARSRKIYQHYLDKHGFHVDTASDGARALSMARFDPPDLITVDMSLGDDDGWQLLQELKQDDRLQTVPVIMMTKFNDSDVKEAGGAVEYLTKPIDWEQFGGAIRRWVRLEDKGRIK